MGVRWAQTRYGRHPRRPDRCITQAGDSPAPASTPRDLWALNHTRRRLTPHEQEIALLIGAGLKDIVIARRLGLSSSTVRTHLCSMRFRLGLSSRAALVAWVAARYTPDHPEAGLRRGPAMVTPAHDSRLRA
jgi:DNA-binding NarL/FixJ family response regulator